MGKKIEMKDWENLVKNMRTKLKIDDFMAEKVITGVEDVELVVEVEDEEEEDAVVVGGAGTDVIE